MNIFEYVMCKLIFSRYSSLDHVITKEEPSLCADDKTDDLHSLGFRPFGKRMENIIKQALRPG